MVVMQHQDFNSCLHSVEQYLRDSNLLRSSEVAQCQISSENIKLGSCILELVNNSKLNWSASEKSYFIQWLEYVYLFKNNKQNSTIVQQILQEINLNLSNKSFLINNSCTVADVMLYSMLYDTVAKMTFQDKEQYLHLSRWFNTIQKDPFVRQSKPLVNFSRTMLYL